MLFCQMNVISILSEYILVIIYIFYTVLSFGAKHWPRNNSA